MRATTSLLAASALVSGVVAHAHDSHHSHSQSRALPSTWHHASDHPVHALFARDDASAAGTPEPGSAAWVATFPADKPDPSTMPQAWKDALAAAVASGKVPKLSPSTPVQGDVPSYPPGSDLKSVTGYCVSNQGCRVPGDIWDAPDGVWGLGFDDGPLPASDKLYAFLKQNNQHATHFFIGKNIIAHIPEFNTAFKDLQDDIAVHTWFHPQMTTLDNDHIVAELGYTLQAIRDLTGGRLAKYWRPPTGDIDARVSAIAREVFGMNAIIWNNDPRDWALADEPSLQPATVSSEIAGWLKGPKSPGVIILEHELTDTTVSIFMENYPIGKAAGWNIMPVSNGTAWRNAADDTSAPTSAPLVLAGSGGSGSSTTGGAAGSSTGSGAASTGSGSGSAGAGASGSKTSGSTTGSTTGTAKPSGTSSTSGAKAPVLEGWSVVMSGVAVVVAMIACA